MAAAPRVRTAAVYQQRHDQAAWTWLTPMVADTDSSVRRALVLGSSAAPPRSARRVLRKALTDSQAEVREAAARVLHGRGGLLFALMQRKALLDPAARVRIALVQGPELGQSGDRGRVSSHDAVQLDLWASRILRRALRDSHPRVRQEALGWLIGTDGPRTITLFSQVLRHGDRARRRRAVEALAQRHGAAITALLNAASRDPDPGIRRLADDYLQELDQDTILED